MKKIVFLSFMLLLATSLFAQFYIGGYGTSWWVPYRMTVLNGDGASRDNIDSLNGKIQHTTAVQVPWGGGDIAAGIYAGGNVDWGGLSLSIGLVGGASNMPDSWGSATGSAVVWAKPFHGVPVLDTLKISLGTPSDDKLQGKIGSSNLVTYLLNTAYRVHGFRIDYDSSQNNIFAKLNPYNWGNGNRPSENLYWPRVSAGALVTFEPLENLFIGLFVAPEQWNLSEGSQSWWDLGNLTYPVLDPVNGDSLDGSKSAGLDQDFYDAEKVYRKMQISVGYDIPNIGLARVQYLGIRNVVEAAFQLKAIKDLVVDVGFKFPFESTYATDAEKADPNSTYKKKRDYQLSLGMQYTSDTFNLMARVDSAFGGSDSQNLTYPGEVMERGLNLIAYVVPSYKIGKDGTLGMDFAFEYEQHDKRNGFSDKDGEPVDQMKMGAALWFARDMGNVQIKFAACARLPLAYGGSYDNGLPLYWVDGMQAFELMFPLMISVGF